MLRTGFLAAPQVLLGPLRTAKKLADWQTTQNALAKFKDDGHHHRHLRWASRVNGERHGVMTEAVRQHLSSHLTMHFSFAGLHICAIQRPDSHIYFERVREQAPLHGIALQTIRSFIVQSMERNGLVRSGLATSKPRISIPVSGLCVQ
ncbi:MAG: hypothetical protein WKF81_06530 [Thermomicrobiales bacterium]